MATTPAWTTQRGGACVRSCARTTAAGWPQVFRRAGAARIDQARYAIIPISRVQPLKKDPRRARNAARFESRVPGRARRDAGRSHRVVRRQHRRVAGVEGRRRSARSPDMGGSPWGALLGSDGAIYVTQGGNVPGSRDQSAVPGIQRVNRDGSVELLASQIAGRTLAGPNDLAFGPDGRLWFTESGTEQDDRFGGCARPGRAVRAGRSGGGEILMELPGVYPNGIAFDAAGALLDGVDGAPRVPAGRRAGGDVLPAHRRPRARRHGVRRRRAAVRVHDHLGRA